MRLTTVKLEGAETAAVVLDDGAVPVATINGSFGTGWPTELLHLLAGGHLAGSSKKIARRWF